MKIKIISAMGVLCLVVLLAGCCGGQGAPSEIEVTEVHAIDTGDASGQAGAVRVEEGGSKESGLDDGAVASGITHEAGATTATSGRDEAGNENGSTAMGSQNVAGGSAGHGSGTTGSYGGGSGNGGSSGATIGQGSSSSGGGSSSNSSGGSGSSNSSGGSGASRPSVGNGGSNSPGGSWTGTSGNNQGGNSGSSSSQILPETSCSHVWDKGYIATPSDCERVGNRIYRCEKCGDQKSQSLTPLGHVVVIDHGYAPSCTSPGLSDGSHCDRCGKVFAQQMNLEMIDHDWTAESVWISGYLTCYCGQVFYDADSYFSHFNQQEVPAEHGCVSTPGYQKNIYTCSMCGRTLNND